MKRMKWILLLGGSAALALVVRGQEIAPDEVYSSNISPHTEAPQAATPFEGGNKSMFSKHDNRERVVDAPEKAGQIKKLKFGSDQSLATGAFQGSLLDKDIDMAELSKGAADKKQKHTDEVQLTLSGSPEPKPKAIESPTATPAETPSPTPRASASPQDRH